MLGGPIISPISKVTFWRAANRGLIIGVLSYLEYISTYSAITSRDFNSFIETIILILIFGSIYIGFLIFAAGAVAGVLLFSLRKSRYPKNLNNPKISLVL